MPCVRGLWHASMCASHVGEKLKHPLRACPPRDWRRRSTVKLKSMFACTLLSNPVKAEPAYSSPVQADSGLGAKQLAVAFAVAHKLGVLLLLLLLTSTCMAGRPVNVCPMHPRISSPTSARLAHM